VEVERSGPEEAASVVASEDLRAGGDVVGPPGVGMDVEPGNADPRPVVVVSPEILRQPTPEEEEEDTKPVISGGSPTLELETSTGHNERNTSVNVEEDEMTTEERDAEIFALRSRIKVEEALANAEEEDSVIIVETTTLSLSTREPTPVRQSTPPILDSPPSAHGSTPPRPAKPSQPTAATAITIPAPSAFRRSRGISHQVIGPFTPSQSSAPRAASRPEILQATVVSPEIPRKTIPSIQSATSTPVLPPSGPPNTRESIETWRQTLPKTTPASTSASFPPPNPTPVTIEPLFIPASSTSTPPPSPHPHAPSQFFADGPPYIPPSPEGRMSPPSNIEVWREETGTILDYDEDDEDLRVEPIASTSRIPMVQEWSTSYGFDFGASKAPSAADNAPTAKPAPMGIGGSLLSGLPSYRKPKTTTPAPTPPYQYQPPPSSQARPPTIAPLLASGKVVFGSSSVLRSPFGLPARPSQSINTLPAPTFNTHSRTRLSSNPPDQIRPSQLARNSPPYAPYAPSPSPDFYATNGFPSPVQSYGTPPRNFVPTPSPPLLAAIAQSPPIIITPIVPEFQIDPELPPPSAPEFCSIPLRLIEQNGKIVEIEKASFCWLAPHGSTAPPGIIIRNKGRKDVILSNEQNDTNWISQLLLPDSGGVPLWIQITGESTLNDPVVMSLAFDTNSEVFDVAKTQWLCSRLSEWTNWNPHISLTILPYVYLQSSLMPSSFRTLPLNISVNRQLPHLAALEVAAETLFKRLPSWTSKSRTVYSFPIHAWTHGKRLSSQYTPDCALQMFVLRLGHELPSVVLAEREGKMDAVELLPGKLVGLTIWDILNCPLLELSFKPQPSLHFTFSMARIRVVFDTGSKDFSFEEMAEAQKLLSESENVKKTERVDPESSKGTFKGTKTLIGQLGWVKPTAERRPHSSPSLAPPPPVMPPLEVSHLSTLAPGLLELPLRIYATTQAGSIAGADPIVHQVTYLDHIPFYLVQGVYIENGVISYSVAIRRSNLDPYSYGLPPTTFTPIDYRTDDGLPLNVYTGQPGEDTLMLAFDLAGGKFHLMCALDTTSSDFKNHSATSTVRSFPLFSIPAPILTFSLFFSISKQLTTIATLERVHRKTVPDTHRPLGSGPNTQGMVFDLFGCGCEEMARLDTSDRGNGPKSLKSFRIRQTNSRFYIFAHAEAPTITLEFSDVQSIMCPATTTDDFQLFSIVLKPDAVRSELSRTSLAQHFQGVQLLEHMTLEFGYITPTRTLGLEALLQRFNGQIDWIHPLVNSSLTSF
ncbi:hypothetical protein P7C70_g8401, partial [Phenoliferia sp. Uapishka_3]